VYIISVIDKELVISNIELGVFWDLFYFEYLNGDATGTLSNIK